MSVLVSPRLSGDDTLGGYPDWLHWARDRKKSGLGITFECAGSTLTVAADTSALRDDLWKALFDAKTYVRSYAFDDYTGSFVPSYSTRIALALLQSTYQTAGVELALPPTDGDPREQSGRMRSRFRSLLSGFAVDWDEQLGRALREQQLELQADVGTRMFRAGALSGAARRGPRRQRADRDRRAGSRRRVVPVGADRRGQPVRGVQPPAAGRDRSLRTSLDREHVLDFHQAISAIGAYPTMQRHLGLVFDLELPLDFVAQTTPSAPGTLSRRRRRRRLGATRRRRRCRRRRRRTCTPRSATAGSSRSRRSPLRSPGVRD